MGLDIIEFRTEPHRAKVASGKELGVILVAQWNPFNEGGTEQVTFVAGDPKVTITPKSVPVTVPTTGDVVTTKLRITLKAPAGTVTRVAAQGKSDDAAFFIEITV